MKPWKLCAVAALATLAGCAIHLPHDSDDARQQSCEVRCADGSRAETHCVKPEIPACGCEPRPAAACVPSARAGEGPHGA